MLLCSFGEACATYSAGKRVESCGLCCHRISPSLCGGACAFQVQGSRYFSLQVSPGKCSQSERDGERLLSPETRQTCCQFAPAMLSQVDQWPGLVEGSFLGENLLALQPPAFPLAAGRGGSPGSWTATASPGTWFRPVASPVKRMPSSNGWKKLLPEILEICRLSEETIWTTWTLYKAVICVWMISRRRKKE